MVNLDTIAPFGSSQTLACLPILRRSIDTYESGLGPLRAPTSPRENSPAGKLDCVALKLDLGRS